jgi:intein/homing endonuclease
MRNKLQDKLSKEILEYEYNMCGSMQKIANKLEVSVDSIYKYFKYYNISYNKNNSRIYNCDDHLFKNNTEESFYLAGFIAADGSLQDRKYSKILKISLSSLDSEHLEKIKKILKSNNPIKIYKVKSNKLINKEASSAELQIVSNVIFDDLKKFNIVPNKTKIYSMPDWLLNHPLLNHFLRGYFDGDGCVSYCGLGKKRNIKQLHFNILGTEKFINQYRGCLVRKCDVNEVKISPKSTIYSLSYSGNNNVKKIYNFLYKNATIFLNRKMIKFNQI